MALLFSKNDVWQLQEKYKYPTESCNKEITITGSGGTARTGYHYPSYFVLLYASTPLFRKSMYASTSRL